MARSTRLRKSDAEPVGTGGASVVDTPMRRSVSTSLFGVGLITLFISMWGGIIPYLGPTFGYSADGSSSWHWNLAHLVLALSPAVVGIVAALVILYCAAAAVSGIGRIGVGAAGLLALLAGGWFTVGPWAWPLTLGSSSYFVPAGELRTLGNLLGYSLGTGLILVVCGGFALGWAFGHKRLRTVTSSAASPQVVDTERPVSAPGTVADQRIAEQPVVEQPAEPMETSAEPTVDSGPRDAPAERVAPESPVDEPDAGA